MFNLNIYSFWKYPSMDGVYSSSQVSIVGVTVAWHVSVVAVVSAYDRISSLIYKKNT